VARTDSNLSSSWPRRFLNSALVRMLFFIVLFFGVALYALSSTEVKVQEKQVDFLTDAVRRAAVQSYALEGRYPLDLKYLEDNYGLIVDHRNYAVYYESMGDNLLPQIRVIPLYR
jgi:hypothetical protein